MDDTRATPSHDGRLGRRVLLSEVQSQLSAFSEGTSLEEDRLTAELNAVLSGSKPAFLETIPGYVRALAHNLPSSCAYVQASNGLGCIYNTVAVSRECHLPPGTYVHAYVLRALENGIYGRILGYGMNSLLELPRYAVSIIRNSSHVSGFSASLPPRTSPPLKNTPRLAPMTSAANTRRTTGNTSSPTNTDTTTTA